MLYDAITSLFGQYTPLAAIFIMIFGALILPGVHMLGKNRTATWAVALILMIISTIINVSLLTNNYVGECFGVKYNSYSGLLTLLYQVVMLIVIFVSNASIETTRTHVGAYYSLLFGAAVGMSFITGSSDLLTIFVGVELASIASYALIALKRGDGRASEAAVKYVITGGMYSALSLYGISMLYGIAGTINIHELAVYVSHAGFNWIFAIGMVCMIAGYGFKIAAVPFHMWAPDVYEGSATPVTIFMAVGSNKMGLPLFMQVFLIMFVAAASAGQILGEMAQYAFAIIATFTMTVGNIVAISQTNIKRMLAYSSIAQAGYMMIVLAVMTPEAASAGMFHMFTHVFMKGGAFLVVGALICAGIGEKISDYKGLAKRAPFLAFAMLLFLFSLAGIPPLAGFTSKFFLFASAIGTPGAVSAQWVWLAFVAILNSAISLYYYSKVVKAMYVDKGESAEKIKIPAAFAIAIAIAAVFVVILGVYPDIIYQYCETAAHALLGF